MIVYAEEKLCKNGSGQRTWGQKMCGFFLLKIKILLPFIVINIVSDNETAKRLSLFKC